MKNIVKLIIVLLGYIGFSQSVREMKKSMTVTFPNGDESIVITAGKQANMLKLTSNNQTIRFDGLELSNHEVVHAKELPGVSSGLDSLTSGRIQYSYYREDEESDQDTLDPGSEA